QSLDELTTMLETHTTIPFTIHTTADAPLDSLVAFPDEESEARFRENEIRDWLPNCPKLAGS
ncbi:MAG: hypothetical protein LBQ92_00470, partial [Propionibacteriaceae bacterium]|nr:hypothetical protein [Propionibacteriaceae bacterium]